LAGLRKMFIDGRKTEGAYGAASVNDLMAAALVDPGKAMDVYPAYRLQRLVALRIDMDGEEIDRFAELSGVAVAPPAVNADAIFDRHLRTLIMQTGLAPLFEESGPGLHHHAIRPTGFLHHFEEVDALGMERWRAYYRSMPLASQMLAASIIWLYRGKKDTTWLRRVPCTWHAAEALAELRQAGLLRDWAKLVVWYPGW
jgi:hypothetical protein